MLIVDDLISPVYQEEIIENFLDIENKNSYKFPWSFIPDVTSSDVGIVAPAMMHNFCWERGNYSQYFDLVKPIAIAGANAVNYSATTVIQARSFLQYPLSKTFHDKQVDHLHVDLDYKHLVVLYYVLDSDGDTIITSKTYDEYNEPYLDKIDDVVMRVTPKQGRAVIFDGKYYHTAEQPKDNLRCIINFNVE